MVRTLRKRVSRWLDPVKPWLRPANLCVFHAGRVGSTVLGDLLGQHPQIHWGGEIYWEVTQQFKRHQGPEAFHPAVDHRKKMRQSMCKAGLSAFGGEVKFEHLDLMGIEVAEFVADLVPMRFGHFVILQRHNILRQVASGLRVRDEGGRWQQPAGEQAVCRQVWIDLQNQHYLGKPLGLLDTFAHIETRQDETKQALQGKKVLLLHFEDDIERNPLAGYRRVCEFLDLEPVETQVRCGRMNPFPLRDIIGNYTEVAHTLAGTRFEWMLEQADPQ